MNNYGPKRGILNDKSITCDKTYKKDKKIKNTLPFPEYLE